MCIICIIVKEYKLVSDNFFNHFMFLLRESNQIQQQPKTEDQPLGHGFNENIKDFSYNKTVD
jgi:hypothetical protein